MVNEQNRKTDGFLTLEGGVDSGFVPSLIQANQLSWAVNTTVRDGFPRPRPGWAFRELSFPTDEMRTAFEDGLFQGAGTYIADAKSGASGGGQPYLVCSISGRIYSIAIQSANKPFPVQELTSVGNRNQPTQPHAWFCQAERNLIVQNMIDIPLFWNGSGVSRSNCLKGDPTKYQVPIGGPMAYGKGRLAVASGNSYTMGDLVGSNPQYGRDTVLYWTENTFLNEGGSFAVPQGPITGLRYGANLDTTLGDGDLYVFTQDNVYAFQAPIDRTVWKNLEYPIQRYAALNFGAVNHNSLVLMNGDVIYRSTDGIRSVKYARRDFQDWGQTPISRQMYRGLRYDTRGLLTYASAVNFDNRLLMTVQPQQAKKQPYPETDKGSGVYHRGLAVLDYHLVSGMGMKMPPAWEGVWTGLNILQIVTIGTGSDQRCFLFVLSNDQRICVWEITKENLFDFDGGDDIPIQWIMESRSMAAGIPNGQKKLEGGEFWYDQIAGEIGMTVKYRPDLEQCWYTAGRIDDCAKYRNCDETIPCGYATTLDVPYYKGQARSRFGIPTPPDVADQQRGGISRIGYEFQLRFENSGYFRLKRAIAVMSDVQENQNPDLAKSSCVTPEDVACDTSACPGVECCDPTDYGYSIYG